MCILRIQMSTFWKKVFLGEDYQISSISDMETKIFREVLEIFRKQCLHWIIKCLRERYNWILFFFKNFFSVCCFQILTERKSKNWWRLYGRVAKTEFLVPGAKFSGETVFSVFSNKLWFSRKNCDFRKRFASGWLKLYSSCPEDRFQGKSLCFIYFFSILSGHQAEKTSFFGEKFSIKLLKCILRVHRKTLRKANFPRKTISFYHFWNSNKKLFETSWQSSKKEMVYTYLNLLVGTL